MSMIAATVTAVLFSLSTPSAVLFSLSTPSAEPVVFAAFLTDDAPAACERVAEALNKAEPKNGRRFYCE